MYDTANFKQLEKVRAKKSCMFWRCPFSQSLYLLYDNLFHSQERQRMMTLERRRSRLKLEASAAAASGTATPTGGRANLMEYPENAEFDELISSLKTGDYFAKRRSRAAGNSGNPGGVATRRRLEFSRERPQSAIELQVNSTQLHQQRNT